MELRKRDYPKDPTENLRWRYKLLAKAKKDLVFREKLKRLFFEDILFAFNAFFYTLDVRKAPNHNLPFCTYPYQDEQLLELSESIRIGRDEAWEKSRDMGASWKILLTFNWFWLNPEGGSDFLVGSRIEDYVDKKGDMRTLFGKLRYANSRLPKWLLPKGFVSRKHDNYMKLLNPETGSSIIGESNNANFSTGGRFRAILFDEFAKWESTDEAAWTAAGDATPCRIANSTPFGAGGQYFKLVTNGKTKKVTLHWSIHPEKALGLSCVWPPPNEAMKEKLGDKWSPEEKLTSPWYEKECERRTAKEIAQELDINYLGSGDPVFEGPAWDSLQIYHKLPDEPKAWGTVSLQTFEIAVGRSAPISPEGLVCFYEFPSKENFYVIAVDVVEGVEGGDYAFITVLNRITKNIDAAYWSRIDEVGLAKVCKAVSDFFTPEEDPYKAPILAIETNGPGLATFDICLVLEIQNLFYMPRFDVAKAAPSFKKGWRTDTNSRNELIAAIREYLIDQAGMINSHRIIGECMTFVRTRTGRAEAKSGCHDDGVMSFGIAVMVDQIVPLPEEARKVKIAQYQDFVKNPLEGLRIEEDTSIEARCLATVQRRKGMTDDEFVFGSIGF